jgi:polyisoprenoid-binding protein YceI
MGSNIMRMDCNSLQNHQGELPMKKIFLALLSSAFFTLSAQAAQTYTFEPTHTFAQWQVTHLGFSHITGKWLAQGTLELDEAAPQNSKVNITIDMSGLSTGIPKLDEHLKSKDFFDVSTFPTATFVSDKVTVTGKDTADVHGNLTIHGITKPATLKMKLNKKGEHPMLKKQAVGFSGSTMLKRTDFGVGAHVPDVSDEVKMQLEAEAFVKSAE